MGPAVYLRNRTVTSSQVDKTPYKLWTGRKLDDSNLRIFGSKVIVHFPKPNRRKWDRKVEEKKPVGFDDYVKGYRVYDPAKKKRYNQ